MTQQINMVERGYNTRLKVLKGKQELTSMEFGLLKCQTVTPKPVMIQFSDYKLVHVQPAM